MKKFAIVLATTATMGLAACNQTPTQNRVTNGALIGGLGGAGVGALVGGGKGAVIGGVAGAAAGGVVAGTTAPRNCTGYDRYGRPIAVVCP